jgi:hypothetical protein
MKYLRHVLVGFSLVLSGVLILFSQSFLERVADTIRAMPDSWWLYIAGAVIIQLAGHWLRMLRTKTVIDQVKKGRGEEQFGALSVGYLCNALLPLRLGELLRAGIIALRLRMSFLYTLTVIILERAIDLLLIGCIVILVSFFFSGDAATALLVSAVGAIVVAGTVIGLLVLLVRENKRLLSFIWRVSSWLNVSLSNTFRFKVWSLYLDCSSLCAVSGRSSVMQRWRSRRGLAISPQCLFWPYRS